MYTHDVEISASRYHKGSELNKFPAVDIFSMLAKSIIQSKIKLDAPSFQNSMRKFSLKKLANWMPPALPRLPRNSMRKLSSKKLVNWMPPASPRLPLKFNTRVSTEARGLNAPCFRGEHRWMAWMACEIECPRLKGRKDWTPCTCGICQVVCLDLTTFPCWFWTCSP